MHFDPSFIAALGGVLTTLLTGVGSAFAWSLSRNLRAIDDALKQISKSQDMTKEEVIGLAKKIAVLEYQMSELHTKNRGQ